MGTFKENKRNTIEKGKEKGEAALQNGEQRYRELQSVKSLIDSITLEDDEDIEMAESLNDSYLEAGRQSHQEEVESVISETNQKLETNKEEISIEKRNVENATEKVKEMQSTTDLARGAAANVENSLRKSVDDYSNMEKETNDTELQLESHYQEILSKIDNLFHQ